jgi:regulator of sigma E protease
MNGVGVIEFAIGFGKPLLQWKSKGTTYAIRAIPLGGFVRMVGDDIRQVSAEMSEGEYQGDEEISDDPEVKELLADRSRWFLEKGYLAKASIVIAGPAFNLIFALILAIFTIYVFGATKWLDDPVIGEVLPHSPAAEAKLMPDDRILSIDGKPMESWESMVEVILESDEKPMTFELERITEGNVESLSIIVTGSAEPSELDVIDGRPSDGKTRIGIARPVTSVPIAFGDAVKAGCYFTYHMSYTVLKGMRAMLFGQISVKHVQGPIGIFSEMSKSAERGVDRLLRLVVFISISLAILNLLPIPILDGGHLLFFTIELIKGSRVSLRIHEMANQVGMAVLLLLMVLAIGNDLVGVFKNITQ